MCGIFAYYKPDEPDLAANRVRRALFAMRRRGPDGFGVETFRLGGRSSIGLGHARLAVMDPAGGAQPMIDKESGVAVVANGEFYGFEELRASLSASYRFKTCSDSEVLIPLYLKYGFSELVKRLRGEFAFLLYDTREKILWACRDRFGIKPLRYAVTDGGLGIAFASQAKALFAAGCVKPNVSEDAVKSVLGAQYLSPGQTMFTGVRNLEPGCYARVDLGGSEPRMDVRRYWRMEYPEEFPRVRDPWDGISPKTAAGVVRALLEDAVRVRMRSDSPVCCQLSGGLDSSAVAGIAASLLKERGAGPLDAFSVTFPDAGPEYDESESARRTAKLLGARLREVPVRAKDMLGVLSDAVWESEGVAVNGHVSCKYILSRAICDAGFKVALTGEGADECFLGYSHLKCDSVLGDEKALRSIADENSFLAGTEIPEPGASRSWADATLADVWQDLGYVPTFIRGKCSIAEKIAELSDLDWAFGFPPRYELARLAKESRYSETDGFQFWDRVKRSAFIWNRTALPCYILGTLGDGCEMANSVEGRLPFLDHQLFEAAEKIPVRLEFRGGLEKAVLREAVRGYVSDEVFKRRKRSFQAPPLTLLKNGKTLRAIRDELADGPVRKAGIVSKESVLRKFGELANGTVADRVAWEPPVMLLLTLGRLMERTERSAREARSRA